MTSRRRVWNDLLESFDSDGSAFPALQCIVMGDYIWPADAYVQWPAAVVHSNINCHLY